MLWKECVICGKKLLQQDMAEEKHCLMSSEKLRLSRDDYADLPDHIFRKRIAQENLRTKQNNWNTTKQDDDDNDSCGEFSEWTDDGSDLDSTHLFVIMTN